MSVQCVICKKGDTNQRDGICIPCKLWNKEKAEEYKQRYPAAPAVNPGPVNSGTKMVVSSRWYRGGKNLPDNIKRTRKEKLDATENKRSFELSKAESKIADSLDELGESAVILEKLA